MKTRWKQNYHFYYSYQNYKVIQILSYSIRWSVTKKKNDKNLISLCERFYLVLEALNIPLTCLLNLSQGLDPQLLIWRKLLRISNNDKSHFYLPEMWASYRGEPPTVVGAAATLEEAVFCLTFGAMSTLKICEDSEKSSKSLWVLRKAFELQMRVLLKEMNNQVNWLLKDLNLLYRPPNSWDTRRMPWAQIELTRGTEETRVSYDI